MGLNTGASTDTVIHVLGVRFNNLLRRQVVEQILHWVEEQTKHMIITAGPEFVMLTKRDADLKHIAHVADLVTPDGIGIVWAAKQQQHDVRERVTGVELVQDLLATAQFRKQPLRVFVLGASDESLHTCVENLQTAYPLCTFAGRNGYFTDAQLPEILGQIEAYAPNVWLVGLGQPRQEKLIFQSLAGLPPCVAIGVGGSIDVWGGTVKRAPALIRKLNVEWLYRLLRQPQRWRRQLALPRFAWQVLRNAGRDS